MNDSTEPWSAPPEELGDRVRFSQEKFRDSDLWANPRNVRVHKVWSACISLTAGWGKTSDTVFVTGIAALANLRPEPVSQILRELNDLGILAWKKDSGLRTMGTLTLPSLEDIREHQKFKVQLHRMAEQERKRTTCQACGADDAIFDGVCGHCGAVAT